MNVRDNIHRYWLPGTYGDLLMMSKHYLLLTLLCSLTTINQAHARLSDDEVRCAGNRTVADFDQAIKRNDFNRNTTGYERLEACNRLLAAGYAAEKQRPFIMGRAKAYSMLGRYAEAVSDARDIVSGRYGRTNLTDWFDVSDLLVSANGWRDLAAHTEEMRSRFIKKPESSFYPRSAMYRGLALAKMGNDQAAYQELQLWEKANSGEESRAAELAYKELKRLHKQFAASSADPAVARTLCSDRSAEPAAREKACTNMINRAQQTKEKTDAYQYRAQIRFAQNNAEGALNDWREIKKLSPGNPHVAKILAEYLTRNGKPAEAVSELQEAIKGHPDNPDLRFTRAAAYAAQGKYPDAEKDLRHILKTNPAHSRTEISLAQILTEMKRYDEAVNVLNPLVNREPGNPEAIYIRGLVHAKAGRYSAAEADLMKAGQMAPESPQIEQSLQQVRNAARNR